MLCVLIQVSGGAGSSTGSGAGGRLAVYSSKHKWWFGNLHAYGGTGDTDSGGPGTVYVEVSVWVIIFKMLQDSENHIAQFKSKPMTKLYIYCYILTRVLPGYIRG